MISYEGELDIDNKLHNFLKITGVLNNVFRLQKTLKNKNKTIQYSSPSGLVIWQRNLDYQASDAGRITATEMKYMRRTAGYTWTDHQINA